MVAKRRNVRRARDGVCEDAAGDKNPDQSEYALEEREDMFRASRVLSIKDHIVLDTYRSS